MQLQVKTVLNDIQHFPGFVFQDIRFQRQGEGRLGCIEVTIEPHAGIPAKCSRCLSQLLAMTSCPNARGSLSRCGAS